ncbi:reverse transcriptase domain-containing protein [Tanacetum coccineum]|uniref:Reverse transcriptase domain-containing protein n=1 Tax=Tanacetum coccineum TaxID=301880 RepID=A0ABQ5I0G7_9ASTR
MGGQAGRGGGRTRGRPGDQSNGGIGAQVGDQGRNQGNDRNQNVNAINDNIRSDVRNVIANNNRRGCTYKEFLACNLQGKALTWWNSQIHTRGREAAVGMSWEDFKTLTREELCPSNEMKKLETELWNHAMVRAGHATYTDRYVYGLASQIRGMVAVMEPKTIQKAVQLAGTLTDEALRNGSIKKNPKKRGNGGRT